MEDKKEIKSFVTCLLLTIMLMVVTIAFGVLYRYSVNYYILLFVIVIYLYIMYEYLKYLKVELRTYTNLFQIGRVFNRNIGDK